MKREPGCLVGQAVCDVVGKLGVCVQQAGDDGPSQTPDLALNGRRDDLGSVRRRHGVSAHEVAGIEKAQNPVMGFRHLGAGEEQTLAHEIERLVGSGRHGEPLAFARGDAYRMRLERLQDGIGDGCG
jgi:hypothetical protein